MEKVKIEANLSIDRSGGAEFLPVVINEAKLELTKTFPEAEIVVRKGFFQTIDGVWASDETLVPVINKVLSDVRKRVLSK